MAEKTEHYDAAHEKTGTSYTEGDKTEHYDTAHEKTGTSYTEGDKTEHYDTAHEKTGTSYSSGSEGTDAAKEASGEGAKSTSESN